MQKLGWYLVAFCMLAGACEKSERNEGSERDENSDPIAGQAGSAGSAGSKGLVIGIGGSTAGSGSAATGGQQAPDLDSVPMPLVRCGPPGAGGAAEDNAGGAAGGAEGELANAAGAPFDETCAPPPSTCLTDITLVYFDEGACVAGFCDWQKKSMDCINSCQSGGCQDSITTK